MANLPNGVLQALPIFTPTQKPIPGIRAATSSLGARANDFVWWIRRTLRGIRLRSNDTGNIHRFFLQGEKPGQTAVCPGFSLHQISSQGLAPEFVLIRLADWERCIRSLSWPSVWPSTACCLTLGHSSAGSLWHGTVLSVPPA